MLAMSRVGAMPTTIASSTRSPSSSRMLGSDSVPYNACALPFLGPESAKMVEDLLLGAKLDGIILQQGPNRWNARTHSIT